MTVTHAFVSAKSDGGDATLVRPSNWNADHAITGVTAVNGTTATKMEAHNTYTDASNYEKLHVGYAGVSSNIAYVFSMAEGTGTARTLRLQAGASHGGSGGYIDLNPVGTITFNTSGVANWWTISQTDGAITPISAASIGTAATKVPTVYATNITLAPSASVTPASNGELVIQATSNTSLTFKYKGSDGTVRSGSITLT